jgi:ATP-dependent Clp protease adaptor protein ClpS
MSDKKRYYSATEIAVKPVRLASAPPRRYSVYLLNDDYTPMSFVVEVLQQFFYFDRYTANQLMMRVHQYGKAVCGVFTNDIAETKVIQVNSYARVNQYPLLCNMEEN